MMDRRTAPKEIIAALAAHAASTPLRLPSKELRADDIRVLFQERNQGKGAALRRGFREARGEIVIVQDADLEYNPQEYFGLIDPIQHGVADVAYGSRFQGGAAPGFVVLAFRRQPTPDYPLQRIHQSQPHGRVNVLQGLQARVAARH